MSSRAWSDAAAMRHGGYPSRRLDPRPRSASARGAIRGSGVRRRGTSTRAAGRAQRVADLAAEGGVGGGKDERAAPRRAAASPELPVIAHADGVPRRRVGSDAGGRARARRRGAGRGCRARRARRTASSAGTAKQTRSWRESSRASALDVEPGARRARAASSVAQAPVPTTAARRSGGRPPSHSHWSITFGQMRSVTAAASCGEACSTFGKVSGRPMRTRTLCGRMRQPRAHGLGADHRDGDDRRAGLQRQAADAALGAAERAGADARALGEDQDAVAARRGSPWRSRACPGRRCRARPGRRRAS